MRAWSNGFKDTDRDWAASLDYAADQERHPWPGRDAARHSCGNPDCSVLTEDALFCTEACRNAVEGPGDEQDGEGCLLECPDAPEATSSILGPSRGSAAYPLPEARASVNVRLTLHGHDCQVTLRDHDERALLERLESLLRSYPPSRASQPSPQRLGAQAMHRPVTAEALVCQWHGPLKESTKAPGTWFCPAKMADGSYCKERWPVKGGSRG